MAWKSMFRHSINLFRISKMHSFRKSVVIKGDYGIGTKHSISMHYWIFHIWIQNEQDITRKLDFVYYLRVSKKSLTWYELRLMHRTFGNLGMTISIHYRIQDMLRTDEICKEQLHLESSMFSGPLFGDPRVGKKNCEFLIGVLLS